MIQPNYDFAEYVLSKLGYSVTENEYIIKCLKCGGFAYPTKKCFPLFKTIKNGWKNVLQE